MAGFVIRVANKILGAKFPIAPRPPLLHSTDNFRAARTAVTMIKRAIEEQSHITEVIHERYRRWVSIGPNRALVIYHIGAPLRTPRLAIELAAIAFFQTQHADEPTRLGYALPVGRITPTVIRAGKDGRITLIVTADPHTPMGAAIEQDDNLSLLITCQDDRFLTHARDEIIVRFRDQAFVPD
jgi:hypothetical protein